MSNQPLPGIETINTMALIPATILAGAKLIESTQEGKNIPGFAKELGNFLSVVGPAAIGQPGDVLTFQEMLIRLFTGSFQLAQLPWDGQVSAGMGARGSVALWALLMSITNIRKNYWKPSQFKKDLPSETENSDYEQPFLKGISAIPAAALMRCWPSSGRNGYLATAMKTMVLLALLIKVVPQVLHLRVLKKRGEQKIQQKAKENIESQPHIKVPNPKANDLNVSGGPKNHQLTEAHNNPEAPTVNIDEATVEALLGLKPKLEKFLGITSKTNENMWKTFLEANKIPISFQELLDGREKPPQDTNAAIAQALINRIDQFAEQFKKENSNN